MSDAIHLETLLNEDTTKQLEIRLGKEHVQKRLEKEIRYDRMHIGNSIQARINRFDTRAAGVNTLLMLSGMTGIARRNAANVRVYYTRVVLDRLPHEFNNYRILHISDTHGDMSEAAMSSLRGILPKLEYDVCLMTGDYRGLSRGCTKAAIDTVRSLRPLIKAQIYGILGNHDSILMLKDLEHMGINMLMNENTIIEKNGARLHIVGVDDPHHYKCHDIQKASSGIPKDECRILLSHTPETYETAEQEGIDFILCGHTHGGQICLPGGKAPSDACKVRIMPEMIKGLWKFGRMTGYTSTGVGTSSTPVRFNCPPSIAIHTLVCTKNISLQK